MIINLWHHVLTFFLLLSSFISLTRNVLTNKNQQVNIFPRGAWNCINPYLFFNLKCHTHQTKKKKKKAKKHALPRNLSLSLSRTGGCLLCVFAPILSHLFFGGKTISSYHFYIHNQVNQVNFLSSVS